MAGFSIMKKLLRALFGLLPWRLRDRIEYYRVFGKIPNVTGGRTLNEKVLRRKWFFCRDNLLFSMLADKYAVRRYVSSRIGDDYLIELLGVAREKEELEGLLLEIGACVVKPSHGAGMVAVIDHPLGQDELRELALRAMSWLKSDYSQAQCEAHYAGVQPVILLERRIGEQGSALIDYKIHCFRQKSGEMSSIVQVIRGRFAGGLERVFYGEDLHRPLRGDGLLSTNEIELLTKARELSHVLLGDLPYARIDWYIDRGSLYFGEITLTPAAGCGPGYGEELDSAMGEMWQLPDQLSGPGVDPQGTLGRGGAE